MDTFSKKVLTYCTFAIFQGLSFSMFTPTEFFYVLHILQNDVTKTNSYQGYLVSVYSATACVSVIAVGLIFDVYKHAKRTLLVILSMGVIGLFICLIPNDYSILIGKGFFGFSLGHIVMKNTDLLSYKNEKRSFNCLLLIYGIGKSSSFFGLMSIIFILPHINFNIGSWRIWTGNVAIMIVLLSNIAALCICWFVMPEDELRPRTVTFVHKKRYSDDEEEDTVLITKTSQPEKNAIRKIVLPNLLYLLKNKQFIILKLHTTYLYNAIIVYTVYLPMTLHSYFHFTPRYIGMVVLVGSIGAPCYTYIVNKIVHLTTETNMVLVSTIGLLMLQALQCISKQSVFSDLLVVSYLYVIIVIGPCVRVLLVSQVGVVVEDELAGTAQSILEVFILFGSTIGSALAGRFANDKSLVILLQLLFGLGTSSLYYWKRGEVTRSQWKI